jgi:glucokinase
VNAARYAIGVDLGGQSAKLGVVDAEGIVHVRRQEPIDAAQSADALARGIVQQIGELQKEASRCELTIVGIGVVMPGYMDEAREKLLFAANLPTLSGSSFLADIRKQVRLPIRFDADCNGAAFGELHFGAGRNVERLIVVTVGTGIGGSVVIGGEILRINHHISGSLGHIIVDAKGERCTCGARGCLETKASGRAIERIGGMSGEEIGRAIVAGDADALRVVRECGWWLGAGIASWCAIYMPQRMVIGGGIAALGEHYFEAARAGLREVGQPHLTSTVEIVPAALGPDAGMIGAAAMALSV